MDTALQNLLTDGSVTLPLEKFQMILERMSQADKRVDDAEKEKHSAYVHGMVQLAWKAHLHGAKMPVTGFDIGRDFLQAVSKDLRDAGYEFSVDITRGNPVVKYIGYKSPRS